MSHGPPTASSLVRAKALEAGPPGERWLADLPDLIAQLQAYWRIKIIEPLPGGSAAWVARARTTDDQDVVVKLIIPGEDHAAEAATLARANGRGYARLLAHDDERRALLLEALGPSLEDARRPPERTIEILCDTLRAAWQPRGHGPEPVEDKAVQLARTVTRLGATLGATLDRPRIVTRALAYAERRAAAVDPGGRLVVHGDPHPGNALRVLHPRAGAESGYVFVDPDGFVADPAYDLGVVLRDWCEELLAADDARSLARRWTRLAADRTGVEETAIAEWAFLERVSTGLYLISLGEAAEGRRFLDTADRLV